KDLGTTISWVRWSQDWRHLIYALAVAIVFVLVLQFSTRNPAQVFYRLRRPATLAVYVLSALSVFFLIVPLDVFSPAYPSAGTVQPEQYWFVWISLFFLALWAFKPRKTWFWSVVPCVVVGGAFYWAAMTLSPDHALSGLFLANVFSVGTAVIICAFNYHCFRDSLPVQQSGSVLALAVHFFFYALPQARDMVAGWSVAAAQLPAAATVDVATQAAAISLIQLVDVTAPSLPLAYPQAGLLLPALAFAMAAFFLNWRAGDVGPGGMGWPGKTTSLEKAKAIMGRWMAAPSDVERHFGIAYSPRELKKLSRIPWAEDVLKDAAKTHVLFPGYPLTVVDLCEKAHSSFLGSDSLDWYRSKRFTSRKTVDLRWHLIRKETRQFGAGTYGDHVAGLNRAEELPRAVEVAYLIALFDHVARVDLFTETVVHCADQTKAGYHAGVGWGGVGSWADWAAYPATHFRLQLAPSRKPYR
ncbi:MAG: hypothetical protein GY849_03025, partial [Deltaproteobacteria bacterium]|nr:hypothetical protein [Deltaproteobacteria bacterium]